MAAIGREGGHSRGARARAAAGTGSGNTDVAQGAGSQPFVREATDSNSPVSSNSFGSQERSGSREERSNDSSNESGSFSSNRDRF
jgi:hypothetical protein